MNRSRRTVITLTGLMVLGSERFTSSHEDSTIADVCTLQGGHAVADDFAGLKQTIKDTFDALIIDKGMAYNSEDEIRVWRQFIALFRQKATANGVTNV